MNFDRIREIVQPWATAVAVEGATITAYEFALREVKKHSLYKNIKRFGYVSEPVALMLISLLASATLPPDVARAGRVLGSYGLFKLLSVLMKIRQTSVAYTDKVEGWGFSPGEQVVVLVRGRDPVMATADGSGKVTVPATFRDGETVAYAIISYSGRAVASEEIV